jgi:hypothetical protein
MWGSLFDDFFERSESGVEKGYRQLGRVCHVTLSLCILNFRVPTIFLLWIYATRPIKSLDDEVGYRGMMMERLQKILHSSRLSWIIHAMFKLKSFFGKLEKRR